jgi:hypothetical protein
MTPLRLWEEFERLDLDSDTEVRAFAAEWNFHHRVGGEWLPLVSQGRIHRAAVKEMIGYQSIMGIATDAASRLTDALRRSDKAGALREAEEIQVTTRVFFENNLAGPSLELSLETGLPRLQKSFLPYDLVESEPKINTIGTVYADFIDSLEQQQPILKCSSCQQDFIASAAQVAAKFRRHRTGKGVYCGICTRTRSDYQRRQRQSYFRERAKSAKRKEQ